jgi:formylglycine-generating enzyme required for sulfatase activity
MERGEKNYELDDPIQRSWGNAEYGCRADTTLFYFGETITPDLVNYDGNYPYGNAAKGTCRQETTQVGRFPANAFGVFDSHDDAWEWFTDPLADLILFGKHFIKLVG